MAIIFICALCQAEVELKDKTAHESTHNGAVKRMRGARMLTDAQFVHRNWTLKVGTTGGGQSSRPITLPGLTAAMATGVSIPKLMSITNPNLAAGSVLQTETVRLMLQAIQDKLNYAFDPNFFYLGFASWYAATMGSTTGSNLGSFFLRPDDAQGNNEPPRKTEWAEVFDIWAKFGTDNAIAELTPRMFFAANGVINIMLDIYKSHDDFADARSNGIKQSNEAGFLPADFWKALPKVSERRGNLYDERDRKCLAVAQSNAIISEKSKDPYSMKFDPTFQTTAIRDPVKNVPADEMKRRNMALNGMAAALRSGGSV